MVWEDFGLIVCLAALAGIGLMNWFHSKPIDWVDEDQPVSEARSARSE